MTSMQLSVVQEASVRAEGSTYREGLVVDAGALLAYRTR